MICECGERADTSSTLFGELCWACRYASGLTQVCSCGCWFEPHDGLYPDLCGICAFPLERADYEKFEQERAEKIRMEIADDRTDANP